ncbi:N-6 DNA methylase [Vibrio parahaemolyticus]|uniref:N-6 DNA methylase n=1 Tax=Vibrio parahaemolyticus TaxID=670 RepID=UPI0004E73F88|nr:N-6 DNA methylase [Vibrio parahaemolyticus]EGQ9456724.1 N-6 DNA methylase [Vibrio parahaemolyticus]KFE96009.1 restriction endonuclease subunit M [Vibrio parahaemolyticus]MBE4098139.1 N-6 DNA methylase [Vibrio parahaemolyticus]MBE4132726.1 N-6 DNA methylase [Vibrio parahaemolyticus]MBE4475254.1 N-6 DNA methylase [Vibrio parahaemolyticus]
MNNKLMNIIELIRKDTGINNAIDAVEQLALLLLVRYTHEVASNEISKENYIDSFKNLFFDLNDFSKDGLVIDFYTLRDKLNHIVVNSRFSENELSHSVFSRNNWEKIENILDQIPFRIRSTKILDLVIHRLEELDLSEGIEVDFDRLLLNMVKDSGSSGAYYSPRPLIKAMVSVLNPKPLATVYDPAMGTGGVFVEAKNHAKGKSCFNGLSFIGNDLSPFAHLIGALNLLLNDIDISGVSISDSLLDRDCQQYDFVISGVPFGKVNELTKYEYYYHGYSGSLEAMFLKHTMDKLAKGGRAAIVIPDGILFGNASHLDELKRQLLTQFNLHTVLSLPKGTLAPYSGVKVSVLFFDNTVSEKDIWFYELRTDKPLSKVNSITDSDFEDFTSLYERREVSENSCLISKESLLQDKTLNLSFSLPKKEAGLKFDKQKMIASLKSEQLALVTSIENHFDNVSRSFELEYIHQVTLKDVCKLRSGKNLNKDDVENEGAFPVYGGNGIIGYCLNPNRPGDSIVIGKVGAHCGNIHFSSKPYWLTSNAISLELLDTTRVYLPYLAHVLKSLDLNNLATGTAQKFVSINKLYEVEVSLPSLKKQQELSDWFTSIEESKSKIQSLLVDFSQDIGTISTESINEKALKE